MFFYSRSVILYCGVQKCALKKYILTAKCVNFFYKPTVGTLNNKKGTLVNAGISIN